MEPPPPHPDREILGKEINRAVQGQAQEEVNGRRDAQVTGAKQAEIDERLLPSELDDDKAWDKDGRQDSSNMVISDPRPIAMALIPIQSPSRKRSSCIGLRSIA